MTSLIIILSIILLFVVLVQIAKINEITTELQGAEESLVKSSLINSRWLLIFCVLFLAA